MNDKAKFTKNFSVYGRKHCARNTGERLKTDLRLMNIAVIGAGAAGCFAAVHIKEKMPEAEVTVYEAGSKPLRKLALTGGGRCNLTNSFKDVRSFESVYPRGARLMKRLFNRFSNLDTMEWFTSRGIRLLTQDDRRVFPASEDAMEVVNALMGLMGRLGVRVMTRHKVCGISRRDAPEGYIVRFRDTDAEVPADKVLITTGGCSADVLKILEELGIETVPPVPSLFSFNIGGTGHLTGTSVENVTAGIAGTGFRSGGPLLLTDWGMSGPAILKLSSYAARHLADNGYKATLILNWTGGESEDAVLSALAGMAAASPQKQLSSTYPEGFNSRLWSFILEHSGIDSRRRWAETGSKTLRRISAALTADSYPIEGRNKFKGEFVTCGGAALTSVVPDTLECRSNPGLHLAGEVLDIDAVTGGFNLQAAWTTAMTAAEAIASPTRSSRP